MLVCILAVLLSGACLGQVTGTWKMIPSKSHYGTGVRPQALSVTYETKRDAEVWTFHQVRNDGFAETTSQSLRFDGKEYPSGDLGLESEPDGVIASKVNTHTVEVCYRKLGKVTRRVVRTISVDGKELTLHVYISSSGGTARQQRMVFAR